MKFRNDFLVLGRNNISSHLPHTCTRVSRKNWFSQKSILHTQFITYRCQHLFDDAKTVYHQRLRYEKTLTKLYNVKPSDVRSTIYRLNGNFSIMIFLFFQPAGSFFNERQIDPENLLTIEKANTIVEFKEMLRNKLGQSDDCCEASSPLDFDRLLEEYNECIPEHSRCISRNISCNGYYRCEHFHDWNL